MQTEQWQKIEEIFNEAVLLSEEERMPFIVEKSSGDVELENEVLSLIAENNRDEGFLSGSVFDLDDKLIKNELRAFINQHDFDFHPIQNFIENGI